MLSLIKNDPARQDRAERIRADVRAYLYDTFTDEESPLVNLDRWTQRRISSENLAKLELALDADDPVEFSYRNLIREIDTEAEAGAFLVRPGTQRAMLRPLVGEAGISGKLYQELDRIAPELFADELRHSDQNLDLVWVTIHARYDRAAIDARVSGIILKHLLGNTSSARDMCQALRALLYAFHEDRIRRQCRLPLVLNDRATRDLVMMVSELAERSGDYVEQVRAISERASRPYVRNPLNWRSPRRQVPGGSQALMDATRRFTRTPWVGVWYQPCFAGLASTGSPPFFCPRRVCRSAALFAIVRRPGTASPAARREERQCRTSSAARISQASPARNSNPRTGWT